MTTLSFEKIQDQLDLARQAARKLTFASTTQKNAALHAMGEALLASSDMILRENARDCELAAQNGQSASRIDRLRLTKERLEGIVQGIHEVIDLPDPIGEVIVSFEGDQAIQIAKVRVPLGVIAMIYEARPNVTVDAAALTLKSGNAVILRGGKEAIRSNIALVQALQHGLNEVGLPVHCVSLIEQVERETIDVLLKARGKVDLIIPRGGAGLINHVVENSIVPVIETGVGNCHVYVDEDADLAMALAIIDNAKTQRPSVCNAIETVLLHSSIAERFLPDLVARLTEKQVEIRLCDKSFAMLESTEFVGSPLLTMAQESDYETEFLDLILAVKIVDNLDQALEHIYRYGTKHSEAIVTADEQKARRFLQEVDAAAVYHNASTRFTDGFEFGFGAEIGISTQKLHARGPMGLPELTSYTYRIRGQGQIRP